MKLSSLSDNYYQHLLQRFDYQARNKKSQGKKQRKLKSYFSLKSLKTSSWWWCSEMVPSWSVIVVLGHWYPPVWRWRDMVPSWVMVALRGCWWLWSLNIQARILGSHQSQKKSARSRKKSGTYTSETKVPELGLAPHPCHLPAPSPSNYHHCQHSVPAYNSPSDASYK